MRYEREVTVLVRYRLAQDDGSLPFSETMTLTEAERASLSEAQLQARTQQRYDNWLAGQQVQRQQAVETLLQDKARINTALGSVAPDVLAAAEAKVAAPSSKVK